MLKKLKSYFKLVTQDKESKESVLPYTFEEMEAIFACYDSDKLCGNCGNCIPFVESDKTVYSFGLCRHYGLECGQFTHCFSKHYTPKENSQYTFSRSGKIIHESHPASDSQANESGDNALLSLSNDGENMEGISSPTP